MLQPINLVIGTAWTIAGLLSLGLALPLIANRVGRNSAYGVRFPESFRSEEAWFAINHFGGKRMALWSVPQILWGIAAYFVPMSNNTTAAIAVGTAPILFLLIGLFETWRFARRYDAATQR